MLLGTLNSGPQPCPAVRAQVKSATPNIGMTNTLIMNIQRRAGTLKYRNGNDASQKMAKHSKSGAVIEALAGSPSACHVLKDGQIASIMHRTAFPPREPCTPYHMTQTTARTT